MNRVETFQHIAAEAARGEITLPASVNAALRLKAMLDDPNCHVDDAIKLVSGEPQLAARVVAMANSAAFNRHGGDEVTSVRGALGRVGYNSLKTLVASLIVKQMAARIIEPKLRAKAERLWLHSANVAALAHVLAGRVTKVDPDTALFAGIVHEVGGIYLIYRSQQYPGLLDDLAEAEANADADAERCVEALTHAVLEQLGIPEAVKEAIVAAVGDGNPPAGSVGGTLKLANAFALVASPLGAPVPMPQPGESELGFVADSAQLTKLIDESTDELRSMIAALMC